MSIPNKRSPVAPGQMLAGKYRLEREIGAGSMGVVVEAWHIGLDQRVAIKFLYPEFASDQEGAERFRREARASASIESEHVAKVLDIGMIDEGRTLYYVMEFLRGHDLSRELALRGPLPVRKAVDCILETCEALAEAHGKGIVHRDLKPANLFLVERPSGEQMIKVVDFGISKIIGSTSKQFSLTDTATLMGSPAYMCPEQLESSRSVDGRADIWSLGVILHELILGQIPFSGESVPQLVRSILQGKRAPITTRSGVPAGLETVVERCLRQDREERFGSITELRYALIPFSSFGRRTTPPGSALARSASDAEPLAAASLIAITGPAAAPGHEAASRADAADPRGPAVPIGSVPALGASGAVLDSGSRPESPEATGQESHTGAHPISWGRTQRGQSWRRAMYRRGVPAFLLVALTLGVGYWISNSVWLSHRLSRAAERVSPPSVVSAPQISAGAPEMPRVSDPPPSKEAPSAPVIRALQPAPKVESGAAPSGARENPPAQRAPEQAVPAPPPPAVVPPPRATATGVPALRPPDAVHPPGAVHPPDVHPPDVTRVQAPASAAPGPAKPASAKGPEVVLHRGEPEFLRRLQDQDYGGRE